MRRAASLQVQYSKHPLKIPHHIREGMEKEGRENICARLGRNLRCLLLMHRSLPRDLVGKRPECDEHRTEVQGISFVGSTSEVCCPHPLCNLQYLCLVPP